MDGFMGDEQRVRDAIRREVRPMRAGYSQRFISHGTARTIGAWFNDGADTDVYAFVSTGAMPTDHDADVLYAALMRGVDQDTRAQTPGLHELRRYLDNRVRAGATGPVPGWSDMWAEGGE